MGRQGWRGGKRLLVSLLSLPIGFLGAELLTRGWLRVSGHPYDSEDAKTSILRAVSNLNDAAELAQPDEEDLKPEKRAFYATWHPHPFYGFEDQTTPPMMSEHLAALRRGRDPDEYQIWILGGSVAWFFRNEGADALRRSLAADPRFLDRKIEFQDYARPGFKQPQQLMQVAYLLNLGFDPDAVINLDGFNEGAFAWTNITAGAHPIYPDIGIWSHAVRGDPADRKGLDFLLDIRTAQNEATEIARFALACKLHKSSILGRYTISRLAARTIGASEARDLYVEHLANSLGDALLGPRVSGGRAAGLDFAVRSWADASRSIESLCAARSIFYLHVLQPTLFDTGSKPLSAEEASTAGDNRAFMSVREFYPRLREAGAELASFGGHFADCSMAFADVSETLYYDHAHFNARGNIILAEKIAAAFLSGMPPPRDRGPRSEKR